MTEEERQSLAEHWVLELAITHLCPVDWFGTDKSSDLVGAANRRLASLEVVDARGALVRLAKSGAVAFREAGYSDWGGLHPLAERELRAAMTGSPQQYGLTALGGQLWEALTHPDWGRFADIAVLLGGGRVRENAYAMRDREMAERLTHWQLLRYGCVAVPGSIVVTEEHPWQSTYWKTLPQGWRISFSYQRVAEPQIPPEAIAFFTQLHTWYESPFRQEKPWLGTVQ